MIWGYHFFWKHPFMAMPIFFCKLFFSTCWAPVCHTTLLLRKHISWYYCWWKKSCTNWDVQKPVNNGTKYLYQLVQDFFHQLYYDIVTDDEVYSSDLWQDRSGDIWLWWWLQRLYSRADGLDSWKFLWTMVIWPSKFGWVDRKHAVEVTEMFCWPEKNPGWKVESNTMSPCPMYRCQSLEE